MRRFTLFFLLLVGIAFTSLPYDSTVQARHGGEADISLINRSGTPVSSFTDGDLLRLQIQLDAPADADLDVSFVLEGDPAPVGACRVPNGESFCSAGPLPVLGWYWTPDGTAQPDRNLQAFAPDGDLLSSKPVQVKPRPVVMVHGFSSSYDAWLNYLGEDGFLAREGIPAFAVGDGQAPGVMNTGSIADPEGRTNTIAENAAILGDYIQAVKAQTGAESVDLLAHSMGGLISRYYIGRVMGDRDIAQLIMLGSPMAGTECANLPASLQLYLPATLEIRPAYVRSIFNTQVTDRREVPFYALAGTLIQQPVKSPCSPVPSDIAISLDSVLAIPLYFETIPILHTELNTSPEAFNAYVKGVLQKAPAAWSALAAPPAAQDPAPVQYTQVYTGFVTATTPVTMTVNIDEDVRVAGFSLFDPSRSLQVTVRGASGNVIELSPDANGLTTVEDPEVLFYLGYGFENPKPGPWQVTLNASPETPAAGTNFALMAQLVGGAHLAAQAEPVLPEPGDEVSLSVDLTSGGNPAAITSAQALIQSESGETVILPMQIDGSRATATWQAEESGLFGIDLRVSGTSPEGAPIDRATYLALQVQPEESLVLRSQRGFLILLVAGCFGIFAVIALVLVAMVRLVRRRAA